MPDAIEVLRVQGYDAFAEPFRIAVQALLDGVRAASVKAKMERLETRKIELTAGLAAAETPSPFLHPRMAGARRPARGPQRR
jgi:hypothetical protein